MSSSFRNLLASTVNRFRSLSTRFPRTQTAVCLSVALLWDSRFSAYGVIKEAVGRWSVFDIQVRFMEGGRPVAFEGFITAVVAEVARRVRAEIQNLPQVRPLVALVLPAKTGQPA